MINRLFVIIVAATVALPSAAADKNALIDFAVRPMITLETVDGPLSEEAQSRDDDNVSVDKMRKIHGENERIRKARWDLAKAVATDPKTEALVRSRLATAQGLERQVLSHALANPPRTSSHVEEMYLGISDERGARIFRSRDQADAAHGTANKQAVNDKAKALAVSAGMQSR